MKNLKELRQARAEKAKRGVQATSEFNALQAKTAERRVEASSAAISPSRLTTSASRVSSSARRP